MVSVTYQWTVSRRRSTVGDISPSHRATNRTRQNDLNAGYNLIYYMTTSSAHRCAVYSRAEDCSSSAHRLHRPKQGAARQQG